MGATKQKIESMMIQLAAESLYPKVQFSDIAYGKVQTSEITDKINDCIYYVDYIHNDDSIDVIGASVVIEGIEDEGLSFDLKYAISDMIDNKAIACLSAQSRQIREEQLHEIC